MERLYRITPSSHIRRNRIRRIPMLDLPRRLQLQKLRNKRLGARDLLLNQIFIAVFCQLFSGDLDNFSDGEPEANSVLDPEDEAVEFGEDADFAWNSM
jgi:hypothetical protein